MSDRGGLGVSPPRLAGRGRPKGAITSDHRPGRPMAGWIRPRSTCVNRKLENSFSSGDAGAMITAAQIRAGRGLLKWTQGVLASRAAVSVVTLNMIESEQVQPRNRTLAAIRTVLEGAGIRFVGDDQEGYGAILRPAPATGSGDGPAQKSPARRTAPG